MFFGLKKKIAPALVISIKMPGHRADNDSDMLDAVCEEILQAVSNKDANSLKHALKSFIEVATEKADNNT